MSSFQFECLDFYSQNPTEIFGKFVFKPLEKGYGITVGNILRRILLTSLPGLSIVGVRMFGINHEFSTLIGVREDILELLLNLKEIIFQSNVKEQKFIGRFKVYGPSIVTARDLQLPREIKLINPNHYIATVMEKGFLEMEVKLEWGKGYRLATNNNITPNSFDFLSVDAIFMPVLKVNYEVQPIFIGHEEIGEELIMEIWTNGSISPEEAIFNGSVFIENWFKQFCQKKMFRKFKLKRTKKKFSNLKENKGKLKKQQRKQRKIKKISLDSLSLSTRPSNCLKRANIKSIDDLLCYSQKDLSKIKGIGPKSLQELVEIFQNSFNICLK